MFELKIITRFAAAHQLKIESKKCENLHGHNWKIEVCVTGENLDDTGLLMDFGILKKYTAQVMEELDHKFLNELSAFNDQIPPSSENIAFYIGTRLKQICSVPGVRVSKVCAWESDDSCAIYHVPA